MEFDGRIVEQHFPDFEGREQVGFVGSARVANGVIGERDLQFVRENIEQQEWVAVGVAELFGDLAVDGGDERVVGLGEEISKKLGDGGLEIGDGSPGGAREMVVSTGG